MKEFIFVINVREKKLKVITQKYYQKASLAQKINWGTKKVFWKYPELSIVKSYQRQLLSVSTDLKTMGQAVSDLEDIYPDDMPLWLLEYKEFYDLVKDNLYLQFLPNSRPIKADEKKIELITKLNLGKKPVVVQGHLDTIYIRFHENQSNLLDKLKKYPSQNEKLDISLVSYGYKKIKHFCAINLMGMESDQYIMDRETQNILKPDPEIKKIISYFNLHTVNREGLENPYSIAVSNLFELVKRYSFSSKDIRIRLENISGKRIHIVNINYIMEQSNTFLQKIMEARALNQNHFSYNNDFFLYDMTEIDKYEEKILDKLLNKELKEFVAKLKELNFNKNIDQDTIQRLEKSGLNADLYEHQKVAVSWFENLYKKHAPGAILADKMGAGKTLQTVAFMSLHPEKDYLIIAPASVIGVWEQEILKFNPTLGKKLNRSIKIISYEKSLTLKPEKVDILILDEAQKIKNNKSLTFKTISNIKKEFVVITTGTPVENKIDDMFSLLEVINPSAYDVLNIFKKIYKNDTQKLVLKSRTFIDPIFLQRDISKELIKGKLNIIDEFIEPEKIELTIQKEIIKVYENKLLQISAESNHDFYAAQAILTGLLRLRQALSYPAQLPDELIKHFPENIKNVVRSITPSKAKNLIKISKQIKEKNEKIVIFTEFRETQSYLKILLEKEGMKVLTLSGSDSSTKRKVMIKEFQDGNTFNVFIIALKAGNSGITLTSANNVYIYDLFWNPAVLAQAVARVHRIGQEKDVNAYFSVVKNSFDESIYKTIIKKKDIIDTFEKGDQNNAGSQEKSINKEVIDLGLQIFNVRKKNKFKF